MSKQNEDNEQKLQIGHGRESSDGEVLLLFDFIIDGLQRVHFVLFLWCFGRHLHIVGFERTKLPFLEYGPRVPVQPLFKIRVPLIEEVG